MTVFSIETQEHSPLSASSAAQWISCTVNGRARLEGTNTSKNKVSTAAMRGTIIHMLSDMLLQDKPVDLYRDVKVMQDDEYIGLTVKKAWIDYAKRYVKALELNVGLEKDSFESEYTMSMFYNKHYVGTADFVKYDNKNKVLFIADLKTGLFKVSPLGCIQLLIYAISIIKEKGYKIGEIQVCVGVYQEVKGSLSFRSVDVTDKELQDVKGKVERAYKAITSKTALKYAPSRSNCIFCPVKSSCPASIQQSIGVLSSRQPSKKDVIGRKDSIGETYKLMLKSIKEKAPTLNDDLLFELLPYFEGVSNMYKALNEYLLNKVIESGIKPKGYTLTEGRNVSRIGEDFKNKFKELKNNGSIPSSIPFNVDGFTSKGLTEVLESLEVDQKVIEELFGSVDKFKALPTLKKINIYTENMEK